jgi:transposase-like protein
MQFPKKLVYAAIGLYTDGLSLRSVRKRIKKIYGILIKSNQTILNWLEKFGKKLTKIVKGVGERLHADETLIKTYKKGVFFYLWVVRGKGTEPVGWHVSQNRTLYETKILMWEAKRRFPPTYCPKSIRTDSMPAYRQAIMKVFNHEVKHEKVLSFKHGNNIIENFFRCKNRFPRFRTLKTAKKFIDHWIWENLEMIIF